MSLTTIVLALAPAALAARINREKELEARLALATETIAALKREREEAAKTIAALEAVAAARERAGRDLMERMGLAMIDTLWPPRRLTANDAEPKPLPRPETAVQVMERLDRERLETLARRHWPDCAPGRFSFFIGSRR